MFNFLTVFCRTKFFGFCLHSTFISFLTKVLAPCLGCRQSRGVDIGTSNKLQVRLYEAKINLHRSNSFSTQLAWLGFSNCVMCNVKNVNSFPTVILRGIWKARC